MIASVPRATLVIANPTHFAVALRYVREENDAPVVVAKGQDLIALENQRDRGRERDSGFRGSAARALHVCASLGR